MSLHRHALSALFVAGAVAIATQSFLVHAGWTAATPPAITQPASKPSQPSVHTGDRVIDRDRSARNLAGGNGLLVWARRAARHRYRLTTTFGGHVHDLRSRASRTPLDSRIGSRADGSPVVTYLRCRKRRCTPYAFDLTDDREHLLRVPRNRGCQIHDVAAWKGNIAYLIRSVPRASCPSARRGLWLASGGAGARRLSTRADRLGDLRDGWVSWFDALPPPPAGEAGAGDRWRLRESSIDGLPITTRGGNDDCCWLEHGGIDDGYIYWTETVDLDVDTLNRAQLGTQDPECPEQLGRSFADVDGPRLGPVVVGGRVFYIEFDLGVLEILPEALHWKAC